MVTRVIRILLCASLLLGCRGNQQGSTSGTQATIAPGSTSQSAPTGQVTPRAPETRAAVATPPVAPSAPQTPLGKIYLQQLGTALPKDDLEFTLRSLAYFFPNEVVVLPPEPLPEHAYYPPRSRYRAEKLLDHLVGKTPEDAQVMVGLTSVDISTTKGEYEDWGILGLATISGRECVISRFRAARGAQNDLHTRQRLAKVVVHEIGHTLGLSHCPEHGCLMEDGKGTVLTTDHELDFCKTCRESVGAKLLEPAGPLPWHPPAHH